MTTLRSSLLALTAATLVPILLVSGVGAWLLVQHERGVAQRSAQERVRALLGAVDVQLAGDVAALQALARGPVAASTSEAVAAAHLAEALHDRPAWLALDLVAWPPDPAESLDGAEALVPGRAAVLPAGPRPALGRAGYVVAVVLPTPDGMPRRALRAIASPEPLRRLLAAQAMPDGGAATILDARQHIVARSARHDEHVGRPATAGARALIERQQRGHVRGRTVDGHAVDTFFDTSPATRWSVAVGMPASTVDAAAWSALAWAALLLALGVAGAFAAAHVGGRRIAAPVAELSARARRLGSGALPEALPPVDTRLAELRSLGDDLDQAAQALRRADAERVAALEREHGLRMLAEDESRSKDRLMATLAHELRNPLSAIRLGTAVLARRTTDPATTQSVAVIDRQAQHLARLIDELLDAARVREGKIALNLRRLRLDTVVLETVAALADRLDGHRLSQALEPVEVDGDEMRLAQVVFNLVGNAARYTPAGSRIEVRLVRVDRDAVLTVRDEGEGIDAQLLPRLFQLYTQGHDGDRGGLGIGLALVRRLVELHGGEVAAHSDGPGRGATFTVRLPLVQPAEPQDTAVRYEAPPDTIA